MTEWIVRETQNLLIAVGRRFEPYWVFANSMLISTFAYFTWYSCFLVVFSQVFAKRSFAPVFRLFWQNAQNLKYKMLFHKLGRPRTNWLRQIFLRTLTEFIFSKIRSQNFFPKIDFFLAFESIKNYITTT